MALVFFSFNKVVECYVGTRSALKENIICRAVKLINSVDLRDDYEKRAMSVGNIVNGVHRIKINFCMKGNPVYQCYDLNSSSLFVSLMNAFSIHSETCFLEKTNSKGRVVLSGNLC